MKPAELDALLKVARRHGVKSLSLGDVYVVLGDAPLKRVRTRKPHPSPPAQAAEEDGEEDILFDAVEE
jgi:hypothetical protein